MVNFLHKKEWTHSEWSIFFGNLDLLRRRYTLKKGELSKTMDVQNIYRKDRKSVSEKIIKNICKNFDVDENWLSTDHTTRNKYDDLTKTSAPKRRLNEDDLSYKLHGDPPHITIEELTGVPRGMGMGRAVEMLAYIYNSKNRQSIRAVYRVLQAFVAEINENKEK